MPRVSIIIPALNAAGYLPFALESVLRQSAADWEAIVVDDGSTDDTAAVVERIRDETREGERIRLVRRPHLGLSQARNTGIEAGSGEYLAFLDADDAWFPERLERGLATLEADRSVGLVHANVVFMDAGGRPLHERAAPLRHQSGRIARDLYMRRSAIAVSTVLIRRACVDAIGLFDPTLRATEDRDLWFRIASRFPVAYIREPLAWFRRSPASMSQDPERMFANQLLFLDKHYGVAGCGRFERAMALASCHAQRGQAYREKGRRGRAIAGYMTSWIYRPWDLNMLAAAARTALVR